MSNSKDLDNPSARNDLAWSMRVAGKLYAQAMDDAIRQAIIGSRIEDIKIEEIKEEPGYYWMTIKTDARPVMQTNRIKFNNNSVIYKFQKSVYDTSTIKVKIVI